MLDQLIVIIAALAGLWAFGAVWLLWPWLIRLLKAVFQRKQINIPDSDGA